MNRRPTARSQFGKAALASALLAFAGALLAIEAPRAFAIDVPQLRGHVNDYAGLLPSDRAAALEARLQDYEQRSKHQFALLTLKSLDGSDIETFSIKVAEQWKLGDKARDDGLILVIVPSERKMRIEVGYGLEGDVPDAIASRVIQEVLAPAFRQNDFAGGVDAAFGVLMHAAGGDEGMAKSAPVKAVRTRKTSLMRLLPLILFILFFMFAGRGGGRRRRLGNAMWLAPGMMGGGGFGGGGGWGGGGGGGGGFRGGGGGGFGGGGASGGW